MTEWLSENTHSDNSIGFVSRGGRKPETTGIWMWSEIFTHDFENGDKVAIILLDTQGIFDNRSSKKECTSIFAISMMLASVQCFNVMQNVQEVDLEHLELFTEYGRHAMQQTKIKPFQKLLFVVRDWQCADEIPIGYSSQYVDEILNENEDQTSDMHELRNQIKSSFNQIDAFLMPHPGQQVANGSYMDGNLNCITSEFIDALKLLVPSIFAPENLTIKKIGERRVRAGDLATYLEEYVKIFNSDTLPDPKSVLLVRLHKLASS